MQTGASQGATSRVSPAPKKSNLRKNLESIPRTPPRNPENHPSSMPHHIGSRTGSSLSLWNFGFACGSHRGVLTGSDLPFCSDPKLHQTRVQGFGVQMVSRSPSAWNSQNTPEHHPKQPRSFLEETLHKPSGTFRTPQTPQHLPGTPPGTPHQNHQGTLEDPEQSRNNITGILDLFCIARWSFDRFPNFPSSGIESSIEDAFKDWPASLCGG